MYEGEDLFIERLPSRQASAGAHLARMTSLPGPPPDDLLREGEATDRFFDENGNDKVH
jgi:hypothetical protein